MSQAPLTGKQRKLLLVHLTDRLEKQADTLRWYFSKSNLTEQELQDQRVCLASCYVILEHIQKMLKRTVI